MNIIAKILLFTDVFEGLNLALGHGNKKISSVFNLQWVDRAVDGDFTTSAISQKQNGPWIMLAFKEAFVFTKAVLYANHLETAYPASK